MAAGDSSTESAARPTWLRQWRDREGLSQEYCATQVGVSRNRWSEIEGGSPPFFDLGLTIEKFTGIPPRDFFRTDALGRKHKRKE